MVNSSRSSSSSSNNNNNNNSVNNSVVVLVVGNVKLFALAQTTYCKKVVVKSL